MLETDIGALQITQLLDLLAALAETDFIESLQFAHQLLSLFDRKRIFSQALPVVYSLLYPTVFEAEAEQRRPNKVSTRTYALEQTANCERIACRQTANQLEKMRFSCVPFTSLFSFLAFANCKLTFTFPLLVNLTLAMLPFSPL